MLDLILILLIAQLGDVSFSRREAAAAVLRVYGEVAVPALQLASLHHADPEVRHRASGLLGDWWMGFFRPSDYDKLPWLDMLPMSHPGRGRPIACYVNAAHDAGSWACYQAPHWTHYRIGTALYIEELIEEGWTRAEVVELLDQMVVEERKYLERLVRGRSES